jgi:hypothetical protein
MLFNDDKYNKEDALSFTWNPIFWGMGPEKFSYNRETLQKAIIKEMERENWLGVCCEPNSIFIVCNQFPVCGSLLRITLPDNPADWAEYIRSLP